jgi:folate-binding protein YgfZ
MFQSSPDQIHCAEAKELNEFYQFETPSLYSNIEHEFDAATDDVVVIDRSWIGRIEVTGSDRLDLLHRLSTNNLLVGKAGEVISTVFTTDKGRVVDYVHVLVRGDSLLLLTSPSSETAFSRWIEKYTIMEDVHLNVVTQSTVMVSLIGPRAKAFSESLIGSPLAINTLSELRLPCGDATFLYRNEFQTDFVDFIVDAKHGEGLWSFLLSRSANSELTKMGTRAYDTFRITRGIPAFGLELTDSYNPYEVGLLHAISFTKGCYIGQEVIARLDTYQKVQKSMHCIAFEPPSARIESGAKVLLNEEEIGVVTSMSKEVIRGKLMGIGILKKGAVHTDDHISVVLDGKAVHGVIRSMPALH